MTDKWIKLDVEDVKNEIRLLIARNPEISEDVELLYDSLEGQTGFNEVMSRVLDRHLEASSQAKAVKDREADLKARRERLEATADGLKAMMMAMMKTAGTEKVVLTEATLSLQKPRNRVTITNIEDIPQGFFRIEKIADKKAIMDSVKSGVDVPGAIIEIGTETLSVRTS